MVSECFLLRYHSKLMSKNSIVGGVLIFGGKWCGHQLHLEAEPGFAKTSEGQGFQNSFPRPSNRFLQIVSISSKLEKFFSTLFRSPPPLAFLGATVVLGHISALLEGCSEMYGCARPPTLPPPHAHTFYRKPPVFCSLLRRSRVSFAVSKRFIRYLYTSF